MKFKFSPPWWGIFLLLLSCGLFIKLGLWQLSRAQEKADLIEQSKKITETAISLSDGIKLNDIQQFQTIKALGQYQQNHYLLLDNQFYQHQLGYEVFIPYQVQKKLLLVDLGWIKAGSNRQVIPKPRAIIDSSKIKGRAYYPSDNIWISSEKLTTEKGWPIRISKIDFKQLAFLFGKKLYPFILRLDQTDPNALAREWQVVAMKPEKHKAYAFQWFCFAIIALIVFIALNMERIDVRKK